MHALYYYALSLASGTCAAVSLVTSGPIPTGASFTTIDDAATAWSYGPQALPPPLSTSQASTTSGGPASTTTATPSTPCPECLGEPDTTKLYGQTFHEIAGGGGTVALSFIGVGLSVFGVCPGPVSDTYVALASATFALDGEPAGKLSVPEGACPTFVYGQRMFFKTGLASGPHNFTLTTTGTVFGGISSVLLDFAVVELPSAAVPGSAAPMPGSSSTTSASTTSTSLAFPTPTSTSTSTSVGITSGTTVSPQTSSSLSHTALSGQSEASTVPSSGSSTPHRTITSRQKAGIVVGTLALLVATCVTGWLLVRRARRAPEFHPFVVTTFPPEPPEPPRMREASGPVPALRAEIERLRGQLQDYQGIHDVGEPPSYPGGS